MLSKQTTSKLYYEGAHGTTWPRGGKPSSTINSGLAETLLVLEPRILLDAAAVATGAEAVDQTTDDPSQTPDLSTPSPEAPVITDDIASLLDQDAGTSPINSLVFIDTAITDYETILAGIDPSTEVVLLDTSQDGLQQIAHVLDGYSELDSLHIISHGSAGKLILGNNHIDFSALTSAEQTAWQQIGQSLSETGDILLYGCDFAAGELGAAAITTLVELTGADITASEDDTGHESLGGDWDLEVETGEINSVTAVDEASQEDWQGLLAPPVAADDSNTTPQDTQLISPDSVLTNDSDPDGDPLIFHGGTFTTDQGGSITFYSDGTYTYTPPPGFSGTDTVTYEIRQEITDFTMVVDSNNTVVTSGNAPRGVDFSDDGLTMFVLIDTGSGNSQVAQYSLDTAYDVSTATRIGAYNVVTSTSSGFERGLAFSSNGLTMFIVNRQNAGTDRIYQYDLAVAWDVLSGVTENTFMDTSGPADSPQDVDFSTDGLTMFVTDGSSQRIYQYSLTTPWDVDTASHTTGDRLNVGVSGSPTSASFSSDGLRLFVTGGASDDVHEYALTNSFDITSGVSYIGNSGGAISGADGGGVYFLPDSSALLVLDSQTNTITEYALPTETATLTIEVTNAPPVAVDDTADAIQDNPLVVTSADQGVLANDSDPEDDPLVLLSETLTTTAGGTIAFNTNDGTYTYTPPAGFEGTDMVDYALRGGKEVTDLTMVMVNNTLVTSGLLLRDVDFSDDGLTMFALIVTGGNNSEVAQFSLSTAYDISTATRIDAYTVVTSNTSGSERGLAFSDDGLTMFIVNRQNGGTDRIYQYDLAVAWDVLSGVTQHTFMDTSGPATSPQDVDFSADGLTMFVTDEDSQAIYQYSLTTPWDIDTATYTTGDLLDVGVLGSPTSASFSSDGLRLFVVGGGASDDAHEYALTNPFDITSGVSYIGDSGGAISGAISGAEGGGLYFLPDSSALLVLDSQTNTIAEYLPIETATLTITVSNAPPVAVDDTATTTRGNPLTSPDSVLDNDTDEDSDPHTVTTGTVSTTAGGTITFNTDGTYTYIPLAGFVGTDTVEYTIDDGTESDTGTLTITVTDTPPVAADDSATIQHDTPLNSPDSVLTNDSDPDGDPLIFHGGTFTTDQGGSITFYSDGTYIYTPPANFVGIDTVTYEIRQEITDFTMVVDSNNTVVTSGDAPRGVDFSDDGLTMFVLIDTGSGNSQVAQYSLDTAYDVSTATRIGAYNVVTSTSSGFERGLAFSSNGLTMFIVNRQNAGTDRIYQYDLAVAWDVLSGVTENTFMDTSGPADSPQDVDFSTDGLTMFVTDGSSQRIYQYSLTTPWDVDTASHTTGDRLNVGVSGSPTSASFSSDGLRLFVTGGASDDVHEYALTNSFDITSGVSYIGDSGGAISGADAGGVYFLPDSSALLVLDSQTNTITEYALPTETATLTIAVTNVAPVAVDDTVTIQHDTSLNSTVSVLENDTDGDTDSLTVTTGTVPTTAGGTITFNTDGNYTYDPPANFVGIDTVTYTVTDGIDTDTGTLTITVTNVAPVAVDDSATIQHDTLLNSTVSVLNNDTDGDSDTRTVTTGTVPTTAGGTITFNTDGNYTYDPPANFVGIDTVTYTVTDGIANDTGTLTIAVTNVAPVAVDDSATIQHDTLLNSTVSVLNNDTDGDSDTRTVTTGTVPTTAGGTITFNTDGNYTYDPPANFAGIDTVTYTVTDGIDTDTGTLTIAVTNVAPVAVDDSATIQHDTSLNSTVSVLENDTDGDSDTRTVTTGTVPTTAGGTITFNTDGNYTYDPPANFAGIDTVTYTVTDGIDTDTGTLTITVTNVPPVAADDSATIQHDTSLNSTVSVLNNDTDGDSDTRTVTTGTVPTTAGGTITFNTDGNYTYDPPANFVGIDTVTYTVTDGIANDTGTLTIAVTNVAPVATDDSATIQHDTSLNSTVSVLENDTDGDSDTRTVTTGTVPTTAGGTITFNTDGNYTYDPPANFVGIDTVTYTVTDGIANDTGTLTIAVTNVAPVAVDDSATIQHDTSLNSTVSVLNNDTDGDSDTRTVTTGTVPTTAGGTITFNTDGNYTYDPPANFAGIDTVTYTVTDGIANDTGTLTIAVTNVAPVAVDDTVDATQDSPLTSSESVLENDTDGDSDTRTVTTGTVPTAAGGTIIFNTDGNYTYDPPAGFEGTDTVTYTVTDGIDTDTGTLTITVTNVPPVAADDTVDATQDNSLTSSESVLDNDTDGDTDSRTVTTGTVPTTAGGTITFNTDGNYTYDPPAGFEGTDTVEYTVTDGTDTDTATLTIAVTNVAPVAVDDTATIQHDTSLNSTVSVLDNDTDGDSDTRTVTTGTVPTTAGGTITFNTDGNYTYDPPAGFVGTDTVTYTVHDGTDSDTGTLTIAVTNVAPVAVDDTATIQHDTSLNSTVSVLNNDTDGDSDTRTVTTGTVPTTAGGTITFNTDGNYTYDPPANFVGIDTVTYTVTDGIANDTGTLTIAVTNVAPVATDDSATIQHDTSLNSTVSVLENDTDGDSDTRTVTTGTVPTTAGGTITFNTDGNYTYDPPANFVGIDTVTYTVTDGIANDTGTLTIAVTNVAPVAVDDSATIQHDTSLNSTVSVLNNDTDGDSDTRTVTTGTVPTTAGGTITFNTDGNYTYDPPANFAGIDTVTYTVTDGIDTDTGTLTIAVTNVAPVAVDDTVDATQDSPLTSSESVLENDTDGDSDTRTVTTGTVPTAAGGTIIFNTDGNYTYDPPAGFEGTDTVTYTVTDGIDTDTGTLTITVTNVPPVAADDTVDATQDNSLTSSESVLDNDTDGDTDSRTVTTGTVPTTAGGTITFNTDGNYTYDPPAGFEGTDTVEYTVTDGTDTDTATLTITVTNVAPVAVDDTATIQHDTSLNSTVSVLDNDTDGDTDSRTVTTGTVPTTAGGTITFNTDGNYTYDPPAGFVGIDTVEYTVHDGTDSDTGTLTIAVTNVAPVATDDTATIQHDTSLNSTVSVLDNDTDGDSDTRTVTTGTVPTTAGGTITFNTDGNYTYDPPANFVGIDTVTYTVTDGIANDTGTLTIAVTNVAPVAVDDTTTIQHDTSLNSTVSVLENDTDGDSDTRTVTTGTVPTTAGGTITFNTDGNYTYDPPANFVGIDTVTYTVTDGIANDTGTLTIAVTNVAPVAVDDTTTIQHDTSLNSTVSVLENDTDGDSDTRTVTTGTVPTTAGGTITFNTDGNYTYDPPANFVGIDTVTYTVTDGIANDTGTLTIAVTNAPPVAVDDTVDATQDNPLTSSESVLDNDTDGDSDTRTVTAETVPTTAGGIIVFNTDGNYAYFPPAGFEGTDTVTYTVTDGIDTDTGTLTITVNNVPPVAADDTVDATQDNPLTSSESVLDNDTDGDTDSRTVTTGTVPTTAGGTITFNTDGNYTYDPPAGFEGTDTVEYTVTDGTDTDTATLTITVNNAPPVAVDDTVDATQDNPLVVTLTNQGVLDNDTDGDSDSRTVTTGTVPTTAGGTITFNTDGTYTYDPPAGFEGTDTVEYTVHDGTDSDTGTLTITVNNAPPVAADDGGRTVQDTRLISTVSVLDNDTDGDTDSLTVTTGTVSTAAGGTITFNTDGNYIYDPPAGFEGTDTVEYTVYDGTDTDTATLIIAVPNTPPVAADDSATTTQDTTLVSTDSVLNNDTDIDILDTLAVDTAGTVPTTAGGTITFNTDGTYTYQPPAGFDGTDTVEYTLTDGTDFDTATLTITVINELINSELFASDSPLTITSRSTLTNLGQTQGADLTQGTMLRSVQEMFGSSRRLFQGEEPLAYLKEGRDILFSDADISGRYSDRGLIIESISLSGTMNYIQLVLGEADYKITIIDGAKLLQLNEQAHTILLQVPKDVLKISLEIEMSQGDKSSTYILEIDLDKANYMMFDSTNYYKVSQTDGDKQRDPVTQFQLLGHATL